MKQTSKSDSQPKVPSNRRGLRLFRLIVALLVVLALIWSVRNAVIDLRAQPISLGEIDWFLLAAAVLVYLLTMSCSWYFWHRVLISFGQKPKLRKSLRAFFASQLGKYVPGKAMVVVLRTGLVKDTEVAVVPAAASVFVETITWIFVGSAIGGSLLLFQNDQNRLLQLGALLMMLTTGLLTWPPVFAFIVARIRPQDSGYSMNYATLFMGWTLLATGWCLNATSLWLVVSAIPGAEPSLADFPVMLAAVTLATVGGFLSLLPGGLGVRELVMIPLLGSPFGAGIAVIAAILIRFVWLAAELISSGILYFCDRFFAQTEMGA